MVKSVVGEESQLKSVEDRLSQSAVAAQVGLIVGKLNPNSDRGSVYDLIPTPPTDGGTAACSLNSPAAGRDDRKKGSKGGKPSTEPPSSLAIDAEWVAEHARQVSRMLLGGMSVIGIYIWASEAAFKATPPSILSQALKGVAQTSPSYSADSGERLLIHISYSPRRWVCRLCTVASGNLRPCDFKMGKLLASLQSFTCTYNFEIRLPISQSGSSDSSIFKNVVRNVIAHHSKQLQSAKALINGELVSNDLPSTSERQNDVELLVPFMNDASAEECSSGEVAGLIIFSGSISAFAYSGPKEPISQVISDIKGDIITSLRSRLDIIADDGDPEMGLNDTYNGEISSEMSTEKSICEVILYESRKSCRISFPRRVLVPWLDGKLICDYLQPSETFEDVKDRCKEMMSVDVVLETSAIVEPETEAAGVIEKSFWDAVSRDAPLVADEPKDKENSTTKQSNGTKKGSSISFLIAIIILLTALFIGWAITVFGPAKRAH